MTHRHNNDSAHKTFHERLAAAQFHLRKNLAKLPYMPVLVRLKVPLDEEIDFWWSYIVPYFDPARGFFDYWGHDAGELRFLWNILRPGMVFFDVGAHHGVYSIVASKRLGASGQVVAFEPSPREYARLRLHFRWNRMRAARAERLAIGSASGDRTFFQVDSGDTTRGSLRPPDTRDELSEVVVNTTSLDHYIAAFPLNRVDVVKIDVEGGELEALKGASALMGKLRPIFICEVLDGATRP
ncbi:MAG: FkbM family methyltransferase, partial [Candidatus Acidiferrales bacterium]